MISDYFSLVRAKLEEISWLIIEQDINFDFVSKDLGIIKGKLIFSDNSILEVRELVNSEDEYKFQYMNKENKLLCRWDSAPHHKVATFPFHLHKKDKIEESKKVNLIEVLDIISEIVINNLEDIS